MTSLIYYDRGGITVTSTDVTIGGERYPLDQLDDLRVVRGPRSRATTGCLTVFCLFLLLTSCSWEIRNAPTSITLVVIAIVAAIATVLSVRLRPRPQELWATYQRQTILLHASRDARTFNQVRFALCRALQADG